MSRNHTRGYWVYIPKIRQVQDPAVYKTFWRARCGRLCIQSIWQRLIYKWSHFSKGFFFSKWCLKMLKCKEFYGGAGTFAKIWPMEAKLFSDVNSVWLSILGSFICKVILILPAPQWKKIKLGHSHLIEENSHQKRITLENIANLNISVATLHYTV